MITARSEMCLQKEKEKDVEHVYTEWKHANNMIVTWYTV